MHKLQHITTHAFAGKALNAAESWRTHTLIQRRSSNINGCEMCIRSALVAGPARGGPGKPLLAAVISVTGQTSNMAITHPFTWVERANRTQFAGMLPHWCPGISSAITSFTLAVSRADGARLGSEMKTTGPANGPRVVQLATSGIKPCLTLVAGRAAVTRRAATCG